MAAPDDSDPAIAIYSLDRDLTRHSLSPFAIKLRLRLRHAGIPYVNVPGNWAHAPKNKIPYVKFPGDEALMGDSALIIQRLVEEGTVPDLEAGVPEEVLARDVCLRAMVENRMAPYNMWERFTISYDQMCEFGPFGESPWGVRQVLNAMMRRYAYILLWCDGLGRHSEAEIKGFVFEAFDALEALAKTAKKTSSVSAEEPFWIQGMESPTEADFTLFGFLASVLGGAVNPWMSTLIKDRVFLADYIKRIHDTYFPELKSPL